MAKATQASQETSVPEVEAAPPMTVNDLMQIIALQQQQLSAFMAQQAESNKALADAIIDSKKPYVDPNKEINEKLFRDNERALELRKKTQLKWEQDHCEHIAGSNNMSEQADLYRRTSIVWHRGDVGQTTGVCTVCGRIIRQTDPDFGVWRGKKSFNKESRAGDRFVPNPLEAARIADGVA